MLSGKRFKLREPVIATALEKNGQRVAAMVPASSIIEIISGTASGLRILDVLWDGKVFAMFESDIAERADELSSQALIPPRKQTEKVRWAAGF